MDEAKNEVDWVSYDNHEKNEGFGLMIWPPLPKIRYIKLVPTQQAVAKYDPKLTQMALDEDDAQGQWSS